MSSSKSPSKPKPARPSVRPKGRALSLTRKKALAQEVIDRLRALDPEPRCELYYRTGYQLLVSVILSAQTTDKMVNRVMTPLYDEGLSPETILALGPEGLLARIRTIGLAPTKSKNVVRMTEILVERHGGTVPRNREELEALPGVGRKTANVVLGELYREPTLAVDTHVFRVTARLGLHAESTPDKCEKKLLEIIDPKELPQAHHWFVLHGRYTCKAVKPACERCPLNDICPSSQAVSATPVKAHSLKGRAPMAQSAREGR